MYCAVCYVCCRCTRLIIIHTLSVVTVVVMGLSSSATPSSSSVSCIPDVLLTTTIVPYMTSRQLSSLCGVCVRYQHWIAGNERLWAALPPPPPPPPLPLLSPSENDDKESSADIPTSLRCGWFVSRTSILTTRGAITPSIVQSPTTATPTHSMAMAASETKSTVSSSSSPTRLAIDCMSKRHHRVIGTHDYTRAATDSWPLPWIVARAACIKYSLPPL